jgi:hypothetical protein
MSGALTATAVQNVKINAETFLTGQDSPTFDGAIMVGSVIPIAATVAPIADMEFTASLLEFLYLLSDQDLTLTFTIGTSTKVIALYAGVPWYWSRTYVASIPCPFSGNPTACTAANASGVAVNFQARGGVAAS